MKVLKFLQLWDILLFYFSNFRNNPGIFWKATVLSFKYGEKKLWSNSIHLEDKKGFLLYEKQKKTQIIEK